MHVFVLCPKMAPLETINWTQVALLSVVQAEVIKEVPGPVGVPDVDTFLAQFLAIGTALDKPQQLLSYAPPENSLCGQ